MRVLVGYWVIPAGVIGLIWLAAFFWPLKARRTSYDFTHGFNVLARLAGALALTVLVCFAYLGAALFFQ